MEIIVGKNAGFCYGVKRAVEGAENELKINDKIACIGEIVHNKQVVESLKKKGMKFIEKLDKDIKTTLIRAHGISKEVYEMAKKEKIEIKDYTCPNVLKIHEIAKKYVDGGYYIFLCGNPEHPENIGTISYCNNRCSIIKDEADIKPALQRLKTNKCEKLLLISQTTYSVNKFDKIAKKLEELKPKNINLVIKNTICKSTELRQKETEQIAKLVDCMIIIGGKNSSNSKKLYEIAKENCNNAIFIETKDELNLDQFNNYEKIGIMAGASTPQSMIDDVVNELKSSKYVEKSRILR